MTASQWGEEKAHTGSVDLFAFTAVSYRINKLLGKTDTVTVRRTIKCGNSLFSPHLILTGGSEA